jgi:hypothetical protein
MKDQETALSEMRSSAAAKDKEISKLVKEKKGLEKDLVAIGKDLQRKLDAATEEAKMWAARAVLEARLKMVKQLEDSSFDKVAWDVAKWEATLANLGDDEEVEAEAEKVDPGEQVGTSQEGAKVVEEAATTEVGATVGDEDGVQA